MLVRIQNQMFYRDNIMTFKQFSILPTDVNVKITFKNGTDMVIPDITLDEFLKLIGYNKDILNALDYVDLTKKYNKIVKKNEVK